MNIKYKNEGKDEDHKNKNLNSGKNLNQSL